jgi:hypothetical protein
VKVQLVKSDIKETFGEGENSFDYYIRPLTVEEKTIINSHIVWTKESRGKSTVDFAKTDSSELVRMSVIKIDRLYDSDDLKIDTIDKLMDMKVAAGELEGILITMWVKIWIHMRLPEETKKK